MGISKGNYNIIIGGEIEQVEVTSTDESFAYFGDGSMMSKQEMAGLIVKPASVTNSGGVMLDAAGNPTLLPPKGYEKPIKKSADSMLSLMMSKLKSIDEIEITIKLSVPAKAAIDMILENFDFDSELVAKELLPKSDKYVKEELLEAIRKHIGIDDDSHLDS